MWILHRNNLLILTLWISHLCLLEVVSAAHSTTDENLLYFDDEQQSDPIEGSAEDDHFPSKDVSSGKGEDDEDALMGSGHGPDLDSDSDGGSGGAIVFAPEIAPPLTTNIPPSTTSESSVRTTIPSTTTTTTTVKPTKKYEPTTKKPTQSKSPPVKPSYPETENRIPEVATTVQPDENDEDMDNEVHVIMGHRQNGQPSAFFGQPGMLAAVIGGVVVGLLFAILLTMFIVYRMRKKDEGSYPLDEPKRSPTSNSYSRSTNKEFYA